jgi:hypothetical protein
MKENKYFSEVSFWLPFGYVFALGLFFTEDSRFTKVLHRDQTDEWKGKEIHTDAESQFFQSFSLFQVSHTFLEFPHLSLLSNYTVKP